MAQTFKTENTRDKQNNIIFSAVMDHDFLVVHNPF